ncbi:MAG: HK97 gp10 family phage protein [Paludibaculum sp.]
MSGFQGYEEFVAKLRRVVDTPYDDDANRAFLAAAQVIAGAARRNAPERTGALKKAIIAGSWRKGADAIRRFGPGGYAQVNLLKRYTRTAPHGHLVEGGRQAVRPRRPWKNDRTGQWVSKRLVKGFAGKYFFRRAVEENETAALEKAAATLQALIERAAR